MIKSVLDELKQDIIEVFDCLEKSNRISSITYEIMYQAPDGTLQNGLIGFRMKDEKFAVGYLFEKEQVFEYKTEAINYVWAQLNIEYKKQQNG